jgi:hypothetical protein
MMPPPFSLRGRARESPPGSCLKAAFSQAVPECTYRYCLRPEVALGRHLSLPERVFVPARRLLLPAHAHFPLAFCLGRVQTPLLATVSSPCAPCIRSGAVRECHLRGRVQTPPLATWPSMAFTRSYFTLTISLSPEFWLPTDA